MKKPLALLLTDTHFDKDNVEVVLDILQQALDKCLELGIDRIFHLGDVFTSRLGQGLMVLLAFKKWIKKCDDAGVKIYLIAGNHDKTDQDSEQSYLNVYQGSFGNLTLFEKETSLFIDGVFCAFLPYFLESGSYPSRLNSLSLKAKKISDSKKILFTHVAVDGVMNNDGSFVRNELSFKRFRDFDSVFVGHYHNRSQVNKNVFYIGSPRPKDFGEDNNKGFTILYRDGSHELISARFKKYFRLNVDVSKGREVIEKLKLKYNNSDDNIRFVISGEEEALAAISSKEFSDLGIELKKQPLRLSKSMKAAENSEFLEFDKKMIMQSFLQYCSDNKITRSDRSLGMNYIKNI